MLFFLAKMCFFFSNVSLYVLGLCPFKCTFGVNLVSQKVLNFGCGCFSDGRVHGDKSLLQEGGAGHTCMPLLGWLFFSWITRREIGPQPYSCPQLVLCNISEVIV